MRIIDSSMVHGIENITIMPKMLIKVLKEYVMVCFISIVKLKQFSLFFVSFKVWFNDIYMFFVLILKADKYNVRKPDR